LKSSANFLSFCLNTLEVVAASIAVALMTFFVVKLTLLYFIGSPLVFLFDHILI
jgi:hypothetical protein